MPSRLMPCLRAISSRRVGKLFKKPRSLVQPVQQLEHYQSCLDIVLEIQRERADCIVPSGADYIERLLDFTA